jgi:hypothetical protein
MTTIENEVPIVKLTTGPLEKEQVEKSILNFLNTIRENINSADFKGFKQDLLSATFELNLVTNAKTGQKYGIAWLWVSCMALYNLLCGKNADGTPSFIKSIDPNWKPVDLGFDVNNYDIDIDGPAKKLFDKSGFNKKNWGDAESFDEMVKEMMEPKEIVTSCSVISLPLIQLTDTQRSEIYRVLGKKEENFEIKVEAAIFKKEESYTIVCRNAPSWVTEEILYPHFTKFNSDPNIYKHKITINNNSEMIDSKFPIIRFKQNYHDKNGQTKTVYVQYSKKHPWDAKAAELMKKQLKLTHNNNNYNLIFFIQSNEEMKPTSSHIPPKFQ